MPIAVAECTTESANSHHSIGRWYRITGKYSKHHDSESAKWPVTAGQGPSIWCSGVSEAATGKDRGIHQNYRQLWGKIKINQLMNLYIKELQYFSKQIITHCHIFLHFAACTVCCVACMFLEGQLLLLPCKRDASPQHQQCIPVTDVPCCSWHRQSVL